MSPASSGALEVERYIGACLFSSHSRNKGTLSKPLIREHLYGSRYVNNNQNNHHVRGIDGWAGGLPLISFANYQRRNNGQKQENHNPLSRLAVHTQGAPLILSNRYDHRKSKSKSTQNNKDVVSDKKECNHNVDVVSVNSDESSGSANTENVLPRIIKPRKRRKKDRKPLHILRTVEASDSLSTDSGSPDSVDFSPGLVVNYLPFSFDHSSYTAFYKNANDYLEEPKLHHSFDDVKEFSKDAGEIQTSSCQCRYCDPSGQIWDVDRYCYSPFLTTPKDSTPEPTTNNDSFSDFMGCMENLTVDDNSIKNYVPVGTRRDLEVSTEIVTSLNGHRDLEIKFFSSPVVFDESKKEYSNREIINKSVLCK